MPKAFRAFVWLVLLSQHLSFVMNVEVTACDVHVFQVMDFVKKMAGQEYVGFSNATWVDNYSKTEPSFLAFETACIVFVHCVMYIDFSQLSCKLYMITVCKSQLAIFETKCLTNDCLFLIDSSRKRKLETGTLLLDTTWRRRRLAVLAFPCYPRECCVPCLAYWLDLLCWLPDKC